MEDELRDNLDELEEEVTEELEDEDIFVEHENPWQTQQATETVRIETGRGSSVEVPVGSNFAETVEQVADSAAYGGYFRVYLNGSEIFDPSQAPERIESGMRIAITAYDKVG